MTTYTTIQPNDGSTVSPPGAATPNFPGCSAILTPTVPPPSISLIPIEPLPGAAGVGSWAM